MSDADLKPVKPKRLYLYTPSERFWHWAQAGLIFALMLSGGALRSPESFPWVPFKSAVITHNVVAVLLLLHALLGLFFFFNSGQIRHYKIERKGLMGGVIRQIAYYSYGIFRGAVHPFEPSKKKRLNILQRLGYISVLNVLLPLQIISGVLLFFAGDLPGLVVTLGGLPVIVAVHVLMAWFFLAFTIMHIYLTTTGHTLLSHIKVMTYGYEEESQHQEPS